MFPEKLTKISLSPDVIDGIVFWTKNPLPLVHRLDSFQEYPYYFQWTVNAYGSDVEPHVPSKNDIIIPTFQKLSEKIGAVRLVWRYDPVFLSDTYSMAHHKKYFRIMAEKLEGCSDLCTFSFLDYYDHSNRNSQSLGIIPMEKEQMLELSAYFVEVGHAHGFNLESCAEVFDMPGVSHAKCIDGERLTRICGENFSLKKAKGQRKECGCMESIDIGNYNSCRNGCRYCYANTSAGMVEKNLESASVDSPLICGVPGAEHSVSEKEFTSCRERQMSLF